MFESGIWKLALNVNYRIDKSLYLVTFFYIRLYIIALHEFGPHPVETG